MHRDQAGRKHKAKLVRVGVEQHEEAVVQDRPATPVDIVQAVAGQVDRERLRMVPAETGRVSSLAELGLPAGAECVVTSKSVELIRGRLVVLHVDAVVLDASGLGGAADRRVRDAEIVSTEFHTISP